MRIKEERETGSQAVDVESGIERALDISDPIAEREANFLYSSTARFSHVVTRNRNGIPLRKVLVGISKNVSDNEHRVLRWINVGAAGNVLL